MRAFEYASPSSTDQAVRLLGNSWDDAAPLAGGTDLSVADERRRVAPKRLVNTWQYVAGTDAKQGLRIGALVTSRKVAESRSRISSDCKTAGEIAGPQLEHITIGGHPCQRPRCWYYRSAWLPAMDQLVPGGDNRYHAILGNDGRLFVSPRRSSPCAQLFVWLARPGKGSAAEKFFDSQIRERTRTRLKPNDRHERLQAGAKAATYEVRQGRRCLALASVALNMKGKTVSSARVLLGHVAPVPWRSTEAEAALVGKTITEEVAQAAGNAAVAKAKSLGHNGYKIQIARVAVKRAILAAA